MNRLQKPAIKNGSFALLSGCGITLFILTLFLAVSVGSIGVSVRETLDLLIDLLLGSKEGTAATDSLAAIVFHIRLPRVILAALVGAALSVAGVAMQGLLKNPLADGSTLGITSGGALGAVLSIVFGISLPLFSQAALALMSILFSFLSLAFILSLSYKIDYSLSTQTIILTGVIFSMLAGSLTSLLVSFSGNSLKQVVFWSMGSFAGRGWAHVLLMLPFLGVGMVALCCSAKELNAFSLGEEQARYIGVNTKRTKLWILVMVSVLVGISVAVSGTIGFVGLVIPHITRLLTGPDHRKLIPLSALFGATFLMLTDLAARTLFSPAELPIGVVTSFVGAILFIYIFYTQNHKKAKGI